MDGAGLSNMVAHHGFFLERSSTSICCFGIQFPPPPLLTALRAYLSRDNFPLGLLLCPGWEVFPALSVRFELQPHTSYRGTIPVRVAVSLRSGGVLLSWPASAEGFGLVSRTELSPGTWETVTNWPVLNGAYKKVLLPATHPGQRLFQLIKRGP